MHVRSEGTELIYIQTDALEMTIKGGTNSPTLPFVRKGDLDSSLALTFYDAFAGNAPSIAVAGNPVLQTESVHGVQHSVILVGESLFFEQTSYSLIAETREERHRLEFDHANVHLRSSITRFGRKDNVLSGELNVWNEVGISDLVFVLDVREYLQITIEVFPSKISYKDDYKAIFADITAEVYKLAFDAFRRTYESYSFSE